MPTYNLTPSVSHGVPTVEPINLLTHDNQIIQRTQYPSAWTTEGQPCLAKKAFKRSSANCLTHGFMKWSQKVQFSSSTLTYKPDYAAGSPDLNGFFVDNQYISPFVANTLPAKIIPLSIDYAHTVNAKPTFSIASTYADKIEIVSGTEFGAHADAKVLVIKDFVNIAEDGFLGFVTVAINGTSKDYPVFAGETYPVASGPKLTIEIFDASSMIDSCYYKLNGGSWVLATAGQVPLTIGGTVSFKMITKAMGTNPTWEYNINTTSGSTYLTAQTGSAKTFTTMTYNINNTAASMTVHFKAYPNL